MPPLLGIIAGMEAEAAALGSWRDDPRIQVTISAGRPNRAEQEAKTLADLGVSVLLSWGIAGGLDPRLSPGTLIIADGVVEPGGRPFAFDDTFITSCRAALAGDKTSMKTDRGRPVPAREPAKLANSQLLAGSETVLCKPADKAALRHRTGAVAVDMETHRVAAIARNAGLPCIAIRAISDPAGRKLPALVASALDENGRPRIKAVLTGIASRPWDLPALIRAGGDSRAALRSLSDKAGLLIPALLAGFDHRKTRAE